jgi:DNA-binding PadR family transcriptional regulator
MNGQPPMSLPEWLVLAILSQRSMHGFAVAQLTAHEGELGRVWQVPKAVIYRAIGRLLDAGLVTPEGIQPGLGPQRTVYTATPQGREASQRWLHTPVEHVRDIRSHLLVKLALLDRAGDDPADLLTRQREVLEPIAEAIEGKRAESDGFEATLLAWRKATATAALDFLDMISEVPSPRS